MCRGRSKFENREDFRIRPINHLQRGMKVGLEIQNDRNPLKDRGKSPLFLVGSDFSIFLGTPELYYD